MATFVLVHGGWVGGWSWGEVPRLLRAKGHEVFTPTLTGLGERSHLYRPDVGLYTHIQDIVNVIQYEDLNEILLAGHSYGGAVISGAADRVHERIAHMVFLDAFVLDDGQSIEMIGGTPTFGRDDYGRFLPFPPPADNPAALERCARWVPQPANCATETLALSMPLEEHGFTCTYVRATSDPNPLLNAAAQRCKQDTRWRYRELPSRHGMHFEMPQQLVELLLEPATATS